jgi:hypothetical protein
MNMPQIRLESTFAQIGLHTEKPIQKIEQPKAVQTIEQPKAQLSIETVPSRLTIDQIEAWAQLGFKPIPWLVEETANYGKQQSMEGIARRVRQGDELMKIENKTNPIPIQAEENGHKPEAQFNIGFIPSYGSVKIHYQPAEVHVKITPQKPIIDVQIRKPIHEYTPGKVHVYLEQQNMLKIDFVNLVDKTV